MERFSAALSASLNSYGAAPCIEFDRHWYSGDDITGYIAAVEDHLRRAGIGPGEPVGLVVRNRVPHAAVILGFIAAERPIVMIYSYQSAQAIARDITALRLPAILADRLDWSDVAIEAADARGSAALALSDRPLGVETLTRRRQLDDHHTEPQLERPGLHILSSGTTGPPKRVPVDTSALQHTVLTMTVGRTPLPDDPPELVYWPFGSIGVCQLLVGPYLRKRVVLLEKFTVEAWVRAVKTYRIRRTGVQPAILRMLLDADVAKEDLASLEYLPGGSGPLDPQLREEFETRFGIPLLWAYGATEFAGSVCAWTPELYRRYGAAKPDSSGKPLPGVQVRIIDPASGDEVAVGERGVLQARIAVVRPDWIRTTDIASVDPDGFITLHGRGDGAINRGGFKILPETVRAVLITHPAVRDACVVAIPDPRLGQVPAAAVELREGFPSPTAEELISLVRETLPSHHVPVAVAIVDELPRNPALKVRPADVAALFQARASRRRTDP
ncbi:class I adenylate-forming enzyme family protein [Mycolicibacter heraklionensis]|uniref:class I adenylate-forming enzyme family protein n=1 Tax=Mycolicibacter heraklionensis TaxID=512402 RepID=UPI0007EACE32|nr:fatty acid--CoA ligase family protein [Mycolicibacter heraklionensis]OBG35483.1 AMP-dependent synthetase [Mycolicibacter heraklionensis]